MAMRCKEAHFPGDLMATRVRCNIAYPLQTVPRSILPAIDGVVKSTSDDMTK
jgi:hypothetical protein